jgi:hypothetical protein
MVWVVRFHDELEAEFSMLAIDVQNALLVHAKVLGQVGPTLGRPLVDTLEGSKHANMKELRFRAADGVWRVAFAFDPAREGILLVAGDKGGVAQNRFYKSLIAKADLRFDRHLETLQTNEKGK